MLYLKRIPWVHAVGIVTLCAFFLIAGFHQGLFFAPYVNYVASALALVGGILAVFGGALRRVRPVWLWFGLMYGAYILLTNLWAAAPQLSVSGSVVVIAAVALMVYGASVPEFVLKVLLAVTSATSGVLYVFGVGTLMSWWTYNASIVADQMQSIFQYHNAFGSFELAGYVIALGLAITARHWWSTAAYQALAALSLLGVISSYSRWVWMLVPLLLILFLLASIAAHKGKRATLTMVYSLVVGLAATPFAVHLFKAPSVKGVVIEGTLLLVGSVGLSLLDILMERWLVSKRRKIVSIVVVVVILAVAAIYLVQHEASKFSSLSNRVASIDFKNTSLQQRFEFYKAAYQMWLSNPVFGSGWGTWTAKFQAYEQFPYWSTQVHSAWIDNLLNGGIIGFVLWIATIGFGVRNAVAEILKRTNVSMLKAAALIAAIGLLIHSAFDFDFSFPMIMMVFFLLLGVSGGSDVPRDVVQTAPPSSAEHTSNSQSPTVSVAPFFGQATLTLLTAVALVIGIMLSVDQAVYAKGVASTDLGIRRTLFLRAAAWAPFDAQPHIALAQLSQTMSDQQGGNSIDIAAAWGNAQAAANKAPWDPSVQANAAKIAYEYNHLPQAYTWARRSYLDGIFNEQDTEQFMGIALWSSVLEYKQNPSLAKSQLSAVLQAYQDVKKRVQVVKHVPSYYFKPEWSYEVTAPMQTYTAAAAFALGQFQQSDKYLQNIPSVNSSSSTQGLANLITLLDDQHLNHGKSSRKLMQSVMSDPTLKTEYQYLTQIQPSGVNVKNS